ncbi:MAG TPA: DNRLRE domain-containing protein [Gaiellaceae bacterium]|nr:DNRLRE domain-containing protein [Gaiellaceae bacterium]
MRRFHITRFRLAAAILLGSLSVAGVGYAATVGLASTKLHTWSQSLSKGACSPTESEAEIDASNPNTNFGNQASETVASKNSGNSYVLIGFDPAASPCSLPTTAGADSATLTIRVTGTFKGPDTISAYPITSPWSAATVTWNTMPLYGATPDFTFAGVGTSTFIVTAPLDAGIKSGAFYGWMLIDTTGTNNATTTIAGYGSGQAPSIALNYEK